MRIELGYPGPEAERALLQGSSRRDMLAKLAQCMSPVELAALCEAVGQVHAAPALIDYIQALIRHSRSTTEFTAGLSPRAGLAMLQAARAWAMMDGRAEVLPEDVQAVIPGVIGHRLHMSNQHGRVNGADCAKRLIDAVAIP